MSYGVDYTWRSLAEASAEATRKFAWIAVGLFLTSSVLAYFSISTHLRYSQTCDYIATHAPVIAVQQTEEALFARALLQKHCR